MAIRLTGIIKRFPGIVANDEISLEILPGEVHCLLGENGAGKSTFISLLAGLQQPDAGEIFIDGVPTVLSSPAISIRCGIGTVYQHSTLIPTLTVLENLMLGGDRGFRMNRTAAAHRVTELAATLGVTIDPGRRAGDLGLGEQQQVEIVKAMWRGSRVLILDEPTSMLVPQAVDQLLRSIRRLRDSGIAVVFVTHKLHEAYAVGDVVTVLRGGRVADHISSSELRGLNETRAKARILGSMFGATPTELTVDHEERTAGRPAPVHPDAAQVLRVSGLSTRADHTETPIAEVSLAIRAGEIVGIAGVDGHGQRHLAEAIAGQRTPTGGSVELGDADVTGMGVKSRQRLGLRYVTDDRHHEGIVGSMGVALNLVLGRIGDAPLWKCGRMNRAALTAVADERVAAFDIRTPSNETRAGTLSGGNIQKLLLARELAGDPRAVIFNKPTYGLDLRTVAHVRETIREYVNRGGAALLISADLDELVDLAHRILVFSDGRVVGEVENEGVRVAERVGALMIGADRVQNVESPRQ